MEIAIKKVGQRDGVERFILVNNQTRQVITISDVTENALRRFCAERGFPDEAVNNSFTRARNRYDEAKSGAPVDEHADTMDGDDLLFQLGLEQDANAHK